MSRNFITDPTPEYVFVHGLEFKTLVSSFTDGTEQRRDVIPQGMASFGLKYNVKTAEEVDRLWNFYRLCKGKFRAFNFQVPSQSFVMIPYDQTTVWVPLHEGEGTKIDDWNGYIRPTYSCRFVEDKLSFEEFSVRVLRSTLDIVQESPITFTNNYGTLSGTYTWINCPDGSSGVSFDGSSGQCTMGDAAALDVGTGDFSFAFGIYANSLSAQVNVLSKKQQTGTTYPGYSLSIGTNGQITVLFADGSVQRTITSAVSAIPATTWKIVAVTIDRDGNGQIYVNNAASGSPVAISTVVNSDNARSFFLGRVETTGYGNCRIRNFLFAKKVWTAAELLQIYTTWRGIFQI